MYKMKSDVPGCLWRLCRRPLPKLFFRPSKKCTCVSWIQLLSGECLVYLSLGLLLLVRRLLVRLSLLVATVAPVGTAGSPRRTGRSPFALGRCTLFRLGDGA